MFDIWSGDVEITSLAILIAVLLLLPTQLLLCFKVKSLLIRLAPVAIFFTITILCLSLVLTSITLEISLLSTFFGIIAFIALAACGLGWLIWAVVRWFSLCR